MKSIIALFCLATLSFGCKKPQGFEYRSIKNFQVEKIGLNKTQLAMELLYFNPNNFGVDLKHVDCDIYINKSYLGKYVLDTTMHIDKRSEFSLPSRIQVDMKNVFKNTLTVLTNQEVQVDVTGNTRVGKAGIFITVPFTYSGKHKFSLF